MDFLSVEAQPLFQQDNELFNLSSQSHRLVEEEESAAEPLCEKPASERRRLKRRSKIPGCSTLSFEHRPMKASGRSSFNPDRRQEVAKVRHLGACLRCQCKKIACSEITPCKPCESTKLLCYRREVDIREIDPVPFSLETVNIFAMGPSCNFEFCKQLIRSHNFSLELNVEWNLRQIFETCIAWLCGEIGPTAMYSRGWVLSKHTTQMLFSSLIPKPIGESVSELLERTTTFYYLYTNTPLKESYTDGIQGIETLACSQMIEAIAGLIKPEALAKTSEDQLIGLSILLFGLLIVVGYSNTKMTTWDQTSESQKGARWFCEARTQLIRVLVYYMVNIVGLLHDPPQKLCEIQLFEQFSSGLGDRGGFDWAIPLENRRPKSIHNNSAQTREEEKQPIPKLILNSSERTMEVDNAQLPSLLLPMEAKSGSTDHPPLDSTTEVIQTMQLQQRNSFQRPGEGAWESNEGV